MAVEPLFNADLDTLLKRARIEAADDEQTLALVYQSVSEVRVGFYSKLGSSRVSAIRGYSLVDNPSTEEELLKASAANTEALWLTWLLAQRLPYLFMDNRSSTGDAFNEEQLTRDAAGLQEFLGNLKIQIDSGLGYIEEPPNENTGNVKVSSILPDTADLPYVGFRGLYPRGSNNGGI